MEQKYGMGNEYGTLLWDIDRMLRDLSAFPVQMRSVSELARENPFHGDAEYAMTTDPRRPLILVQLCEGREKLIDGNHRLYRAQKEGLESIACHCLTVPEQQRYIVDFDEAAYKRIVEHL